MTKSGENADEVSKIGILLLCLNGYSRISSKIREASLRSKMRIISDRDLTEEPETAQRLAKSEPIFIVEEDKIEYVLMTIEEYRKRGGQVPEFKSVLPDETP